MFHGFQHSGKWSAVPTGDPEGNSAGQPSPTVARCADADDVDMISWSGWRLSGLSLAQREGAGWFADHCARVFRVYSYGHYCLWRRHKAACSLH